MTDKESLIAYRIKQAQETFDDAEKILLAGGSMRSVVNRSYYAAFYAVLALFLKADMDVKTSKHSGIISLFDKEFVHTGKISRQCSKTLHRLFDERQQIDYKEFAEVLPEDAQNLLQQAKEFLNVIQQML